MKNTALLLMVSLLGQNVPEPAAAQHVPKITGGFMEKYRNETAGAGFASGPSDLRWNEIKTILKGAPARPAKSKARLESMAEEMGWKLDSSEKGADYLLDVLRFMDRAITGHIPRELARAMNRELQPRAKRGKRDLPYGAVAVSLVEPDRLLNDLGERLGHTSAADVGMIIFKNSGVGMDDIRYAQALLMGIRPPGLPVKARLRNGGILESLLKSYPPFKEFKSRFETLPGAEASFVVHQDLIRGPAFVKDQMVDLNAHFITISDSASAYLLQLNNNTPSHGDRGERDAVSAAKASIGSIVLDRGDRWIILTRHYVRSQDFPNWNWLERKVHKRQIEPLRRSGANFVRLAVAVARLKKRGLLPPLPLEGRTEK